MRVLIAHASSKAREALTDVVARGADEYVEVVTAQEGAETLDLLLQDDPPEVALVDWDLPGIEGPEMCRLVRDFHHGHDTHLVILASAGHTETVDAWRAGAADCISTPASAEVLRAAVDNGVRAMRRQGAPADVPLESVRDAGRDDDGDGPATLDALCTGEYGAADAFGFGAAEIRATMESDFGTTLETERRESEKPRGAALLRALIGES